MSTFHNNSYLNKYMKYKRLYLQHKAKRSITEANGFKLLDEKSDKKHKLWRAATQFRTVQNTVHRLQDGQTRMEMDTTTVVPEWYTFPDNITILNEIPPLFLPRTSTDDVGMHDFETIPIENLICCKKSSGFSHALHALSSSLSILQYIHADIWKDPHIVILDGLNIEQNDSAIENLLHCKRNLEIIIIYITAPVVNLDGINGGRTNQQKRDKIENNLKFLHNHNCTVYKFECPRGFEIYDNGRCDIQTPSEPASDSGTSPNNIGGREDESSLTDDGIMAWLLVLLYSCGCNNLNVITGDKDTFNYYNLEENRFGRHISYNTQFGQRLTIEKYSNQLSIATAILLCSKNTTLITMKNDPGYFYESDNNKYIVGFVGFAFENTTGGSASPKLFKIQYIEIQNNNITNLNTMMTQFSEVFEMSSTTQDEHSNTINNLINTIETYKSNPEVIYQIPH